MKGQDAIWGVKCVICDRKRQRALLIGLQAVSWFMYCFKLTEFRNVWSWLGCGGRRINRLLYKKSKPSVRTLVFSLNLAINPISPQLTITHLVWHIWRETKQILVHDAEVNEFCKTLSILYNYIICTEFSCRERGSRSCLLIIIEF